MNIKERKVTCIICPQGCKIQVKIRNNEIFDVNGNQCPKGIDYAKTEITNPQRIFLSVIKVRKGMFPTVSVKSETLVPKRLLMELSRKTANLVVEAPIKCSDILYEDEELKIKLISTRNVPT